MFWHGSSTAVLPHGSYRLLPPSMTGVLSEAGRKKNLDRVFFTADLGSARIYAGRACARFGGEPVVFRVLPVGEVICLSDREGTSVFHAEGAWIEEVE